MSCKYKPAYEIILKEIFETDFNDKIKVLELFLGVSKNYSTSSLENFN